MDLFFIIFKNSFIYHFIIPNKNNWYLEVMELEFLPILAHFSGGLLAFGVSYILGWLLSKKFTTIPHFKYPNSLVSGLLMPYVSGVASFFCAVGKAEKNIFALTVCLFLIFEPFVYKLFLSLL